MKRSEWIAFIVLLLVVLTPNIAVAFFAADIATGEQTILYLLSTIALYTIGLCLVHKRAYFYIVSLGFAFTAWEMTHLVLRGSTITMLYLYTWFKTPPLVLWSIIFPYWWLILLGVIAWIGFYAVAHYFIERTPIASWKWRLPALFIALAVLFAIPVTPNPLNVMQQLGRLAQFAIKVEKNLPEQRQFTYHIQEKKTKFPENVIVVIGETNYDEWQQLEYRDSLSIVFDSVYTECPVSGVSIPLLLSSATPTDQKPFFTQKSVIQAFNEAGYYTAWLSNYGYHDHFLMRISDDCRYLSYKPYQPDSALLEPFREVMAQPSLRHMITLVTQGARDTANFASTPTLLRQLTDSLRKEHQPVMLIYVGANRINITNDCHGLRVPFVVWANPNYRYRHRALIRHMEAQKTQPHSTGSLFHTLLYMSDIPCAALNEDKAFGSWSLIPSDTIWYFDENLQPSFLLPQPVEMTEH